MDEIKSNKKAFGIYLGEPGTEQLNQFFYLHEKDLELMDTIRRPATRLGFALQLGSLRFWELSYQILPISLVLNTNHQNSNLVFCEFLK